MRPEDEKSNLTGQEETTPEAKEQATDAAVTEESAGAAEAESAAAPVGQKDDVQAEAPADGEEKEENEEDYFSEKKPPKRKARVRRKDMTPEQKRRRTIRDLIITGTVFGLVLIFFAILALCSWVGYSGNFEYIATIEPVDYDSPFTLITPEDSKTEYYEFVADTADREFRVLQLTDVHIGAGAFSAQKDRWAIEAVSTVVSRVKPDLVIVTGDMAYPVPFQAGTFDNMREAEMFATLMEQLGVYWTICFGNHDTEIYSLHDREEIGDFYLDERWEHCLFRKGPEDIAGVGNDVIVVRHPTADGVTIDSVDSYEANVASTKITQALVTIDSHSYTDGDYFGIAWKYDNIHQDQIDWYAAEMDKLTQMNVSNGIAAEDALVKNLLFFHIPLTEYGKYWNEYKDNGHQDTANVHYVYGKAGESGEKSYPGVADCLTFETMLLHGGQGTFCGHDHYNTFAIDVTATVKDADGNDVTGTIRLTYGMSIDYLAYVGIADDIEQRGGTEIKISADGSFQTRQRPYQDETADDLIWR